MRRGTSRRKLRRVPRKSNSTSSTAVRPSPSSPGRTGESFDIALDLVVSKDGALKQDPQGQWELRDTIRIMLERTRDVTCDTDQIIITGGYAYSNEIIASLFEGSLDSLAIEDPALDGICRTYRRHGYDLEPIPMEDDGICTDGLESLRSRLIYLTPTHHFLTDALLSKQKRSQILDWAESNDAYIIEDDYTVDLHSLSLSSPAFQSQDTGGRVIYTGTLSKYLAPGIRAACLILPKDLLPAYHIIYDGYGTAVPLIEQYTLQEYISSGFYDRQLRMMMTYNQRRREALSAAVSYVFGNRAEIIGQGPGEHLLLDVKTDMHQEELVALAQDAGVRVCPTEHYYFNHDPAIDSQIMLGFGTVPLDRYEEAIQRLYDAWFDE